MPLTDKETNKKLHPSRPISPWTMVGMLAALGLVASSVEMIVIAADTSGVILDLQAPKPPFYYYAHGAAILAVIAAGLLAAIVGRLQVLGIGTRTAFLVLAVSAAGWAVATYSLDELFSRAIFGITGPFVWFTLIFLLAGTNRHAWALIDPVIRFLAYATSVLALWTVISSRGSFYYSSQLSEPTQYSIMLMWLGGWTLLSATRLHGWRLAVRAIPYFSLLLAAVFSQARSWTVLSVLLGLVFMIFRAREQRSVVATVRMVMVSFAAVLAIGLISYGIFLRSAVEGLRGRVDEDTRSSEYSAFFSTVPVSALIFGKGPNGTWYWPDAREDAQFADNGFIWMAFIGGLPTLLSYIVLVLWPGIRVLRLGPHGPDAAAALLLGFWALALMGLSTYTLPSVSMSSYLISLLAGRCHLILAERAALQAKESRKTAATRARLQDWQTAPAMRSGVLSEEL